MTIDFNTTGICQNATYPAQTQEQLQKALLRAGENRIAPPQLPSAPTDILGYPSSILAQQNPPPEQQAGPGAETVPPPCDMPDNIFSPEHAATGAVPGDDIITG